MYLKKSLNEKSLSVQVLSIFATSVNCAVIESS